MTADGALRLAALGLAAAGAAVAGYLTYTHYAGIVPACVGDGGGCERVQTSDYAEILGAPVALMGLVGYLSIAAASLPRHPRAAMLAATLAMTGFGFSLYLTYLELFVLEAICQWCVVSAVLMTALAAVAVTRLARA